MLQEYGCTRKLKYIVEKHRNSHDIINVPRPYLFARERLLTEWLLMRSCNSRAVAGCDLDKQYELQVYLRHWDKGKIAATLQITFWNTFLWIKLIGFWFKFHHKLFPMLQFDYILSPHCFSERLCTKQATVHHLTQWWRGLGRLCICYVRESASTS